jgi:KUP system potassium uptake protein
MWTWSKGTKLLAVKSRSLAVPLDSVLISLAANPPHRTIGTAIFLTGDPATAPAALLHNLKHNRVLHAQNIILTVKTTSTPRIVTTDRVAIETINADFKHVTISYGFMETPNLPEALATCRREGLKFDIMSTSFFLSRRSLVASPTSGMPLWQDNVFIFMYRNAGSPADFFRLPAGRVIEMGAQVVI